MAEAPQNIRSLSDDGCLEVTWADGLVLRFPFQYLRGRCPCAGCVNEFTGERMVHVEDVPEAIRPENMTLTGNYALKILWSDRHDTGLYSWRYFEQLRDDPETADFRG